ncbi:MAG: hypothetical protein HKN25_12070 [Pyrinomonadaceae bacterium]|nr:hypothetical protein [Pyrinomonadaceae bacterium]
MNPRLQYQFQNSKQTLGVALEEYKNHNERILDSGSEKESDFFFKPHDACHIIFGCSNNLEDEAITDVWTIFGTDVSLKKFYRFTQAEGHKEIIRTIGLRTAIKTTIKSVPRILRVVLASQQMRAKWEWDKYENYLDQRLFKIRQTFNIRIV